MTLRALFAVLTALLIAGCTSDSLDDLRQFVQSAHADKKPRIEPLPEIKPYEAYAYAASDLPDPFSPGNLRPALAQGKGGGPRPDMNRRREPLEEFPLDALQMVGTLSRGRQTWGVIQAPDGTVHRVQKGNYVGQNFGRIIRVAEAKIDVIELVQGALGDWVEREASLAIQEQ